MFGVITILAVFPRNTTCCNDQLPCSRYYTSIPTGNRFTRLAPRHTGCSTLGCICCQQFRRCVTVFASRTCAFDAMFPPPLLWCNTERSGPYTQSLNTFEAHTAVQHDTIVITLLNVKHRSSFPLVRTRLVTKFCGLKYFLQWTAEAWNSITDSSFSNCWAINLGMSVNTRKWGSCCLRV